MIASLLAGVACAGDPAAGKEFFEQQCIACHTATLDDNGGNQGPSLIGMLGRQSAADAGFDYTKALRDYKVTWDAASLDRFLSAPDAVVPGTAMVVAVPAKSDRDNLLAYLQGNASAAKE